MVNPSFSERHGFAPIPEPKNNDHLPGWVRDDIVKKLNNFINAEFTFSSLDTELYQVIKPYISRVLLSKPPQSPLGGPFAFYLPRVLSECRWWQFYDILEEIAQLVGHESRHEVSDELAEIINASLSREGIPWKIENGKIVRAFNEQIQSVIDEVHVLLTNPDFKGPDEQFQKAIEHLNRRPEPDEENCVKDAVGAIEGVANILCRTSGEQLNRLLNREPFQSDIHPTIKLSIDKIYAYRGAASGVAHGQVGPAVVGIEEASWVLTVSAATILYLVAKFSAKP